MKTENTFGRPKGDYTTREDFIDSGMFLTPREVPLPIAFYQRNNSQTGSKSQVFRIFAATYETNMKSNGYMDSISKPEPTNNGLMKDFHDREHYRPNEYISQRKISNYSCKLMTLKSLIH